MLSPPIPCVALGSSLMISFSISTPISVGVFESIRSLTYSTAFSFVRQSQIPSQPITMNSSSSPISTLQLNDQQRGETKELDDLVAQEYLRKHLALSPSPRLTYCTMSGSAVIICSDGGMFGTCLYFMSPIERDKLRFPLTLPKWFTKPPALRIRLSSRSCRGL